MPRPACYRPSARPRRHEHDTPSPPLLSVDRCPVYAVFFCLPHLGSFFARLPAGAGQAGRPPHLLFGADGLPGGGLSEPVPVPALRLRPFAKRCGGGHAVPRAAVHRPCLHGHPGLPALVGRRLLVFSGGHRGLPPLQCGPLPAPQRRDRQGGRREHRPGRRHPVPDGHLPGQRANRHPAGPGLAGPGHAAGPDARSRDGG